MAKKQPRFTAAAVIKRVEKLLIKENYNGDFVGACLGIIREALEPKVREGT